MLEDLKLPTYGRSCKVATVAATLDSKDREILFNAVASTDWPIKTLSRELRKRGIELSDTPLGNHRSKNCVCYA
jgi:hypothetical protein